MLEAEKDGNKIAVEIKTFGNFSFITALYEAIGKYVVYRNVLEMEEPERALFMAMPSDVHKRFVDEPVLSRTVEKEQFKIIVYNQATQTIEKWIK